jgi:ubiquinone/menaquinone biosynthesis C-methylase UbiE
MMDETQQTYLPAAGHDWFLPLYDPFTRLLGIDSVHRSLLDHANVQAGQRILEIGCGTGNLTMLAQQVYPQAEVFGLDPDPKALARAKRKAERKELSIRFDRGFAEALAYPDRYFDHVFSAFMFHHLHDLDAKRKTLLEVRRVLRRGGFLHLLDFGGPAGEPEGFFERVLHHSHHLKDNDRERVLTLMRDAGFAEAGAVWHRRVMIFGRITSYRASVPA